MSTISEPTNPILTISRSLSDLDVTLSDLVVLEELAAQKAPVRQTDIAKLLDFSTASATAKADKLQKQGLVERRFDDADRRAVLLAILPKGEELLKEFLRRVS
jgi:DNA-binding MarR family transcriptional regulator